MIKSEISCTCTIDELEKILNEIRSELTAKVVKRASKFILTLGEPFSLNPNSIRCKIVITHQDGKIIICGENCPEYLFKKKVVRIVEFRLNQIRDYIEFRLKSGDQNKYFNQKEKNPFLPLGSTFRDLINTFAGLSISLLFCGLLLIPICSITGKFVIDNEIKEIEGRSSTIEKIGKIPIPGINEIKNLTFSDTLAASFIFMGPIIFFIAILYSFSSFIGEIWARFSSFNFWILVFISIVLVIALTPLIGILTALIFSIVIPIFAHLGYSIGWIFRREKRSYISARINYMLTGMIIIFLSVFPFLFVSLNDNDRLISHIRTRDATMLSSSILKPLVSLYYKYTLYGAEVIKEIITPEIEENGKKVRYGKQQVVVLFIGNKDNPKCGEAVSIMQNHLKFYVDYAVEEQIENKLSQRFYDLYIVEKKLNNYVQMIKNGVSHNRLLEIDLQNTSTLINDIERKSKDIFKGSYIKELSYESWFCVYLFSIPVAILILAGFLLAIPANLFRKTWLSGFCSLLIICAVIYLCFKENKTASDNRYEEIMKSALSLEHEKQVNISYKELCSFLNDEDIRVQWWTCHAIAHLPSLAPYVMVFPSGPVSQAVPFIADVEDYVYQYLCLVRLCDLLHQSKDITVRYKACQAISHFKLSHEQEEKILCSKMLNDDWYVGSYALSALRKKFKQY